MTPGLAFLNGKGFHPSSVKNVEKVWLAEEAKKKEDKRLAEYKKQIREQRHLEELAALGDADGAAASDKLKRRGVAWMYEGPSGSAMAAEREEDLLLGRASVEIKEEKGGGVEALEAVGASGVAGEMGAQGGSRRRLRTLKRARLMRDFSMIPWLRCESASLKRGSEYWKIREKCSEYVSA